MVTNPAPSTPTRAALRGASGALALALLAGLLAGCGSSGTKSGSQPASSGAKTKARSGSDPFPISHDDWARVGYRLDWVGFPFPGVKKPDLLSIEAYDDVVIVQDRSSTVTLLEATNGQTRWSTMAASSLTKFVGINRDPRDPSRFIVCSESEAFTLAAATGNLVARESFTKVANTKPVIIDGIAVYGTSTGEIVGHLLDRNVKAWGFATVGAFDANPILVGDTIAAVSQSGDIVFLGSNGSLYGRARVFGPLSTDPVTDGTRLYIAGMDQSVWAFETSGANTWRHRTPARLNVQPAVFDGTLYCHIPGTGMRAFDADTGSVKWTAPDVRGTLIAVRNGRLVFWQDQTLCVVNPERGEVMERIALGGFVGMTTDKFEDGNLYGVNTLGNVAKFIPRN